MKVTVDSVYKYFLERNSETDTLTEFVFIRPIIEKKMFLIVMFNNFGTNVIHKVKHKTKMLYCHKFISTLVSHQILSKGPIFRSVIFFIPMLQDYIGLCWLCCLISLWLLVRGTCKMSFLQLNINLVNLFKWHSCIVCCFYTGERM